MALMATALGFSRPEENALLVCVPLTQPGEAECDACAETLFFVDRRGRALIYFVY
jgi:hypothetical protein